jgi:hypothetical protein
MRGRSSMSESKAKTDTSNPCSDSVRSKVILVENVEGVLLLGLTILGTKSSTLYVDDRGVI